MYGRSTIEHFTKKIQEYKVTRDAIKWLEESKVLFYMKFSIIKNN